MFVDDIRHIVTPAKEYDVMGWGFTNLGKATILDKGLQKLVKGLEWDKVVFDYQGALYFYKDSKRVYNVRLDIVCRENN